jgi:hypothetical protein
VGIHISNGQNNAVAATWRDRRVVNAAVCTPPRIADLLAARGVRV